MTECNICAEKFNKSTRKCIKCEYCEFESCLTCMRTFILDKPEPKCMNTACDRQWTRRFIAANFPITFINKELRPHLADVQFELEKSRLPQSQITLELEVQHKQLIEDERAMNSKIAELREQLSHITHEKLHIKARIDNRYRGVEDTGNTQTEHRKFIRACPATDCRGYLSTAWKCGLCEKYTCPDCHEVKGNRDTEHVCNPDTLASTQAIAKDSKNCPNCSAMIFRIAGCNHMFCTACNTGFDWKTGKIIRGAVGNPHYYDYITQQNGNRCVEQPQPACGNELIHLIRRSAIVSTAVRLANTNSMPNMVFKKDTVMSKYYETPYKLSDWLSLMIRNVGHIEESLLAETLNTQYDNKQMELLRVNYLKHNIDDEQFRMSLKKHTQKVAIKRDVRGIVEMAVEVLKDIASRILSIYHKPCDDLCVYMRLDKSLRRKTAFIEYINDMAAAHNLIMPICDEMEGLMNYVNTELNQVVATYHSSAKPYKMDECGRINNFT